MSRSVWKETSRDKPCPICKSTSWCSYSLDGIKVACRRQANGAYQTKSDKSGGTIYLHSLIEEVEVGDPPANRADDDTCHKVYSALLGALPLSVAHRANLRLRKLAEADIDARGYASLPVHGRHKVAKELLERFGNVVLGVPGIIAKQGKGRRYISIAGSAGLSIPVRNLRGQIVALKIRSDTTGDGNRYRWLSSKKHSGPGPGAPAHAPLRPDGALDLVRLTEGPLKSDIATVLSGTYTVGVAGASNWRPCVELLKSLGVQHVRMAFDADAVRKRAVAQAQRDCYRALVEQGFSVELERWEEADGKGIDDLLAAGKEPEVLTGGVAEAAVIAAVETATGDDPEQPHFVDDGRPEIEVTPDEHEVNDRALAVLSRDPDLYQRGGALVQVVRSGGVLHGIMRPENSPRIVAIPAPGLRERLSKVVRFVKKRETENGVSVQHVHPPEFCYSAIAARGHWESVRYLEGVVDSPVLRPDGTILCVPGYDNATGLLYRPTEAIPEIPEWPTLADARRALLQVLYVVQDFPFDKDEHRAGWLAFLLTPLARYAFRGPAPLFLLDANTRGTGKSLLTDAVAQIVTGREMPRMANPESDDEARKRITALAMAGDMLCLIDNIAGELGSASLDAALTGTIWKDRILGRSEIVELPLLATWCASGNNVILMADTSRRVVHIRLETPLENPEERSDLKESDLKGYIAKNRQKLLAAALTILRAYCVAGKPDQNLKPWGSFEGWSNLIRNAVVWVGMADPGIARQELTKRSDREAFALRQLIEGWPEIDPEGIGRTSAQIVDHVERHHKGLIDCELVYSAIVELCPVQSGKLPSVRSVGNRLRRLRGRIVAGKHLDQRDEHGKAVWLVKAASAREGCSSGSSCSVDTASRDDFHRFSNGHTVEAWAARPEIEQPEQPEQPPAEVAPLLEGWD